MPAKKKEKVHDEKPSTRLLDNYLENRDWRKTISTMLGTEIKAVKFGSGVHWKVTDPSRDSMPYIQAWDLYPPDGKIRYRDTMCSMYSLYHELQYNWNRNILPNDKSWIPDLIYVEDRNLEEMVSNRKPNFYTMKKHLVKLCDDRYDWPPVIPQWEQWSSDALKLDFKKALRTYIPTHFPLK